MQSFPDLFKLKAEDFIKVKTFLIECIEYSYNITYLYNVLPSSYEYSDIINWLQSDQIYIVNRNNKDIGFVLIRSQLLNDELIITPVFFIHPRVCKMASISLLRASVLLSLIYGLNEGSSFINLFTYHSTLRASITSVVDSRYIKLGSTFELSVIDINENQLLQIENTFSKEEVEAYKKIIW